MVKQGQPIPVRFTVLSEKRVRMYAIESDRSLNAAIRYLVDLGLEVLQSEAETSRSATVSAAPMRRILSRGVE